MFYKGELYPIDLVDLVIKYPKLLFERRHVMKTAAEYVRSIPDFPEPGIIFRDITSVLQDADGLRAAVDEMQALIGDKEVDCTGGL